MRERDRIDSTRLVAPLRAATDAVVVDSTQLEIEQVVERVVHLASTGGGARAEERAPA